MSDSLDRIVPEDHKHEGLYRHDAEGKDDMPAHVKSSLVGVTVTVPIVEGRLGLGTWQGLFCFFFSFLHTVHRGSGELEANLLGIFPPFVFFRDLVFGI